MLVHEDGQHGGLGLSYLFTKNNKEIVAQFLRKVNLAQLLKQSELQGDL